MSVDELKPCPFCGHAAEMRKQGNDHTTKRRIVVRCPSCRLERADAAIAHGMDWLERVAVDNWNTRPIEDALRAENAELRARAEAAAWRPIETAPKDGRAVLLHNNNAPGNPSGRMESCEGYNTVVGEWWASDQSDDDADGFGDWTCYMDAIEDPRCPFEPTHWMPLPAAPDQKGDTP